MARWDPKLYAQFEAQRQRPSEDLLARIPRGPRARVVDLGCGSGISTQALRHKYPLARLSGIDNSQDMLKAARQRLPDVAFEHADVVHWADGPADLLFANALFQWAPNHIEVMARLIGQLTPGGCLAAQMPDNVDEPSHALMREVAAREPFRGKLARVGETRSRIGAFADYDAALAPLCETVDIWRTTYVHRLESPDAIVAWVEGAGLRPFLSPLSPEERAHFLALYRDEIAKAYHRRGWGGGSCG